MTLDNFARQWFNQLAAPTVRTLERALEGRDITTAEAEALLMVRGRELLALLLAADEVRRRTVGEVVTYVVVQNINFTNICTMRCRFCAFSRLPSDPQGYCMTPDEAAECAVGAVQAGASEICLQGGIHPNLRLHDYCALLRAIKESAPQLHLHAFSPFEVWQAAYRGGRSVEDTLKALRDAGLDSIPGTAAEILDDEIRPRLAPNKLSASQWVEVITAAHRLGIPTTATILYGHVETPRHQAAHLALLRQIQQQTGGFTEFIPLSFVHQNTPLYRSGEARPGATGVEDARMYAVARLMFQHVIPNIQVSWVKLGAKFAQLCLNAGANDFGGTLFSESISRSAGAVHGEYMPEQEFHRLIRDLGRIPARRSTTYDLLEVFDGALQG